MDSPRKASSDFQGLPDITFRQLEVFRAVYREQSYSNAALELRSTRANIKRVCDEFEKAVQRPLFEDDGDKNLHPTAFAQGLLSQVAPLSGALRRLGEGVKSLHESGRVVRFAAAGEFFRDGLFTDFLSRLQIKDLFRPCFLRVDLNRFRTALLNTEIDVYFGIGLSENERLDLIDLGPVPWQIINHYSNPNPPKSPADLPASKWAIRHAGEPEIALSLLQSLQKAGAPAGRILEETEDELIPEGGTILRTDTTGQRIAESLQDWPTFRFSAAIRKHHPYSELKARLIEASQF